MRSTLRTFYLSLIQKAPFFELLLKPFVSFSTFLLNRKSKKKYKEVSDLIDVFKSGHVLMHIPNLLGEFWVDIRSDLTKRVLIEKQYEKQLSQALEKHLVRDKDVIDIGANVGFFSIFASQFINADRKVLALEPTPNASTLLKKNIELWGKERQITHFNGVASSEKGTLELTVIPGREEYSSITGSVFHDVQHLKTSIIKVEAATLDELVERYQLKPGTLKIDTEGAELTVLKGCHKTIAHFRPVVLIEVNYSMIGEDIVDVMQFFKDYGYSIQDAERPGASIPHQFDGNLLALPG